MPGVSFWQSSTESDAVPVEPSSEPALDASADDRDAAAESNGDAATESNADDAEMAEIAGASLPTMAQLDGLSGQLDQIDAALARMDAESPLPRSTAR